jgi:hypothetical protein
MRRRAWLVALARRAFPVHPAIDRGDMMSKETQQPISLTDSEGRTHLLVTGNVAEAGGATIVSRGGYGRCDEAAFELAYLVSGERRARVRVLPPDGRDPSGQGCGVARLRMPVPCGPCS